MLKQANAHIASLGWGVTLVELNARGMRELLDAQTTGDMIRAFSIMAKWGTTDYRDKDLDTIEEELSLAQLQEIAEKVGALSGISDSEDVEKNSEETLSGSSSIS